MTTTTLPPRIRDAFAMKAVSAPPQWTDLLKRRPDFKKFGAAEPAPFQWNDFKGTAKPINRINFLIRGIKQAGYTADRPGKDYWTPDPQRDCEDKCLHLMERLEIWSPEIAPSLHLAICELQVPRGGQHAVLIFEGPDMDYVMDPTRATFMVDWRTYPVASWIIWQRDTHIWERFSQTTQETPHD